MKIGGRISFPACKTAGVGQVTFLSLAVMSNPYDFYPPTLHRRLNDDDEVILKPG